MTTTARAAIVRKAGAPAEIEEIVLDPPGEQEVRVKIVATGVCHTDLHAKLGNFGTEFPYYLGHEATAVIDAVGPDVPESRIGQTVLLNWRAACGTCRFCQRGRMNFCAKPLVAGPRMRTHDGLPLGRVLGLGTFGTHSIVHAAQAIPIDPALRPEATCLIGCGVVTGVGAVLYAAKVHAGSTVAVYGCGAVGLSVIQGARLVRATRIIGVDLVPQKLEWAKRFGATDVIHAGEVDPVKRIRELTGSGVDYAFEAIGLPQTIAQATQSCDLGGTTVMIGVPVPGAKLELVGTRFFYSRATLKATFYGDCLAQRDFPLLCEWYRKGDLDLDGLVTGTAPLDAIERAFHDLEAGTALRTVLTP